ncbi:IclR family transcriptional regulator [Labrys okinawensis]|uniref:IclR family transcriptional regulator n=1 Tax=Labrys okinawensis TaxID=346911 RepID=UPI0039BC9C40
MTAEKSGSSIQSVQLAFGVLEAVAASQDGVGVSELAAQLGTTKGTIFRHLHTLLNCGYVMQNAATARYSLGVRSYLLGQSAGRIGIVEAAEIEARALRDEVGETAVVSLATANSLVVTTTVRGTSLIEIGVRPGSELSLHATAQGKVALAFSRHPLLKCAMATGFLRHTEATICDIETIRDEIERVRANGYAVSSEEETRGISAIAAPIFDQTGDGVGTIALVGLVNAIRLPPDPIQVEPLLRAAARISKGLGFRSQIAAG